jgi:hypothetical protein
MSRAADLCVESAKRNGVDIAIATRWAAIRNSWAYHSVNQQLATASRGPAFWSWKPFVIAETLKLCADNDVLVYSDAGVEFINNVNYIIDRMDQDIFLFGNNWEHAHWCKRDIIEVVYGESWLHRQMRDSFTEEFNSKLVWDRFGKQCQASVIFFRVSDYTRKFVAEWLKWCLHRTRFSEGICTDGWRYLIDDSPSIAPNHPEFRENRHDQAILTTLAYREELKLHYWPSVYNRGGSPEFVYEKLPEYASDDYPVLFNHHRRRNHEWSNAA